MFLERGDHTFVGTHDGRPYVAPFSGNIIELCPVGALTSTVVPLPRAPVGHRGRGHGLRALPARSATSKLTIRDDAKVVRVLARDNAEVDDGWLCDKGRFGYQSFTRRGADHRADGARRRLPARGVLGARALRGGRGARRSGERTAAFVGGTDHERGGLPRPASWCATGSARRGWSRATAGWPTRRRRAASPAPDLAARGLGHRPRGRDPRGRHRARWTRRRSSTCACARPCAATARGSSSLSARPSTLDANAAAALRFAPGADEAALRALAAALGSPRAAGTLDDLAAARAQRPASGPAPRAPTAARRSAAAAVRAAADVLRDAGDVVVIWGERLAPASAAPRRSTRCWRWPRALGLAGQGGVRADRDPRGARTAAGCARWAASPARPRGSPTRPAARRGSTAREGAAARGRRPGAARRALERSRTP